MGGGSVVEAVKGHIVTAIKSVLSAVGLNTEDQIDILDRVRNDVGFSGEDAEDGDDPKDAENQGRLEGEA